MKYELSLVDGYVYKAEGRPFDHRGFQFVVHRPLYRGFDDETLQAKKLWDISEVSTGMRVVTGSKTKNEAVMNTVNFLLQFSTLQIQKRITKQLLKMMVDWMGDK